MIRNFMESNTPEEKSEDEKNPFMKDAEEPKPAPKIAKPAVNLKKTAKKKALQEEKELNESAEDEGKVAELNEETVDKPDSAPNATEKNEK